jgi:hypothetical protein
VIHSFSWWNSDPSPSLEQILLPMKALEFPTSAQLGEHLFFFKKMGQELCHLLRGKQELQS